MVSALNPKMTPGLAPLPGAGIGVQHYVVNPSGGAPFTTIAAALAYRAEQGITGPTIIHVANGTYSDPLSVPTGVEIRGYNGCTITGAVTVEGAASFRNCVFVASGSTAVDADQGGAALNNIVQFHNCTFVISDGGTGLIASGVTLGLFGNLLFNLMASTGLSLVAGDVADARTEVFGESIAVLAEGGSTAVTAADGAAAGDERCLLMLDRFEADFDGGNIGIDWNATGPANQNQYNGAHIATITTALDGAANTVFRCTAGTHNLGAMSGGVLADTLLDVIGGTVTCGSIDYPAAVGVPRTTFRIAQIGNGLLLINGGFAVSGTGPLFEVTGGATAPVLNVRNMALSGIGGGSLLAFTAPGNAFAIIFRDCGMTFQGDAGAGKIQAQGAAGGGKTLTLDRCRFDSNGPNDAVVVEDAILILIDTLIGQNANTNDCVNVSVPSALGAELRYEGDNTLRQASGGAGRGITLESDAAVTVRQRGLLRFSVCTPAEQLDIGAGAQTLAKEMSGATPVAYGMQSTQATADIIGVAGAAGTGIPSSYPSLTIVDQITRKIIGGGVDDAGTYSFRNEDALGGGPVTAVIPTSGGGGDLVETQALSAARLVGPGQRVTVEATATGANPGTDVQILAA